MHAGSGCRNHRPPCRFVRVAGVPERAATRPPSSQETQRAREGEGLRGSPLMREGVIILAMTVALVGCAVVLALVDGVTSWHGRRVQRMWEVRTRGRCDG